MFEKLNEIYGTNLTVLSEIELDGIPFYMVVGRTFYNVKYEELEFLLVCMPEDDRFGSIGLEKQLAIYQNSTKGHVAYYFEKLTNSQRTALIKRNLPFISDPDQIFLPFLGIMIKNSLNNSVYIQQGRMMPATQSLLLYLVYREKEGCIKKEVAERLCLTGTSISRASKQLTDMGLIKEERNGREINMHTVSGGMDVFKSARQYMINPVQRVLYAELNIALKTCLLSGESALASKTMLNDPKIPVYAVYKKDSILKNMKYLDPKWDTDIDICKIEIWKYDPSLFAFDGSVDPFSLAVTLEGNEDERIEDALEKYMESYKW